MGNCAFPRESGTAKWIISNGEWKAFVEKTYTNDTVDNDKVDIAEVRKNMTCVRKGPWAITAHQIFLGQDFVCFGQLLADPKNAKQFQEEGKQPIGKFEGKDYIFGNKTSLGCASATHVQLHHAKIDDSRTLRMVMSQRGSGPRTINVPVPAGKEEEVQGYISCWQEFIRPLVYQGRTYESDADYRMLWGTIILCDIMVMACCIGMLMMMSPDMFGGGDMGAGEYGAGDAGEMGDGGGDFGGGGFMLF